jgi:hypothetical protein
MNEQVAQQQLPPGIAFERHFTCKELAKLWGFGEDVLRKIFAHEPGVLKIGHPEYLHKRQYVSIRIPESVARRVHARLTTAVGKVV